MKFVIEIGKFYPISGSDLLHPCEWCGRPGFPIYFKHENYYRPHHYCDFNCIKNHSECLISVMENK